MMLLEPKVNRSIAALNLNTQNNKDYQKNIVFNNKEFWTTHVSSGARCSRVTSTPATAANTAYRSCLSISKKKGR